MLKAITDLLNFGKYIAGIAKAIEAISHARRTTLETSLQREYIFCAKKVLGNLGTMFFQRTYIVSSLNDYIRHIGKVGELGALRLATGGDNQRRIARRDMGGLLRSVGDNSATIVEFCGLVRETLPNSVLGMEMKKLMMTTLEVNNYVLGSYDLLVMPTNEFLETLKSIRDAHAELLSKFEHLMKSIDRDAIDRAYAQFKLTDDSFTRTKKLGKGDAQPLAQAERQR